MIKAVDPKNVIYCTKCKKLLIYENSDVYKDKLLFFRDVIAYQNTIKCPNCDKKVRVK